MKYYKQTDVFLEKCTAEYSIMPKNVLIIIEKLLLSTFAPSIEHCKNLADCKNPRAYLKLCIKVIFVRISRS